MTNDVLGQAKPSRTHRHESRLNLDLPRAWYVYVSKDWHSSSLFLLIQCDCRGPAQQWIGLGNPSKNHTYLCRGPRSATPLLALSTCSPLCLRASPSFPGPLNHCEQSPGGLLLIDASSDVVRVSRRLSRPPLPLSVQGRRYPRTLGGLDHQGIGRSLERHVGSLQQ